ncbi:ABC transporter [Reticulomyxa filosa]|uniref:ABC transporter n=1 Tax=Reticulomyxa filosa TaxID=46433 RepID=X6LZK8_RETFI|nr:ABC transporter [Reticulomyxa filosa]|eukprot:ETO07353.1 ABC transporter [Reticulomyxa filosa]
MSYKAFLCFEEETHEVTLSSLSLKSLEAEVIELLNATTINDNDFKIVDNNGEDVTNDEELRAAFKVEPVFFFIYSFVVSNLFIFKKIGKKIGSGNDTKKYPEEKKREEDSVSSDDSNDNDDKYDDDDDYDNNNHDNDECYKIVNPLVLLTGAARYDTLNYLPKVNKDLMMIKDLFEEIYEYNVCCTYNPNHPESDTLTLNELDIFLKNHHYYDNNWDSLIFVWYGYGNTISNEGDVLITSDDHKHKSFKKIQEFFANMFLHKPKIFIKNIYKENKEKQQQQQLYNSESDTFIISSITPMKLASNHNNISHFTECFYNIMSQSSISLESLKSLNDNLISINKLIKQKLLKGQTNETVINCDKNIFLYNNYLLNIGIEMNKNHPWNEANKIAHEMMNEMIDEKQQGIIVVSTNIDKLAKSNNKWFWQDMPFTMMINSIEYMKKKI